jgi:hypothetical protein
MELEAFNQPVMHVSQSGYFVFASPQRPGSPEPKQYANSTSMASVQTVAPAFALGVPHAKESGSAFGQVIVGAFVSETFVSEVVAVSGAKAASVTAGDLVSSLLQPMNAVANAVTELTMQMNRIIITCYESSRENANRRRRERFYRLTVATSIAAHGGVRASPSPLELSRTENHPCVLH